jgi:formylmethanofuran dehydrogenase subunit E
MSTKIFSDSLLQDLQNWNWHKCSKCGATYMGGTKTKDGKEICTACAQKISTVK